MWQIKSWDVFDKWLVDVCVVHGRVCLRLICVKLNLSQSDICPPASGLYLRPSLYETTLRQTSTPSSPLQPFLSGSCSTMCLCCVFTGACHSNRDSVTEMEGWGRVSEGETDADGGDGGGVELNGDCPWANECVLTSRARLFKNILIKLLK